MRTDWRRGHMRLTRDWLASEPRGTLRVPYVVGLFDEDDTVSIASFGRSVGLEVEVYKTGGWLFKRGELVVTGGSRALCRFIERLMGDE